MNLNTPKIIFAFVCLLLSHSRLASSQTIPPLKEARWAPMAAAVGNEILIVGGGKKDLWHESVEILDPSTMQWTLLNTPGLRVGQRIQPSSVSVGQKAYFLPGNLVFDFASKKFFRDNNIPALYGSGVGLVGARLFVAGGYSQVSPNIYASSDRVTVFDVDKGKLLDPIKLSKARGDICSVTVGEKIMFACGKTTGGSSLPEVDIFNLTTNQWVVTKLPGGGGTCQCASAGGKAFFLNENGQLDVLDADSLTWSTPEQFVKRSKAALVVAHDKVLIAGGAIEYDKFSDQVDIYDSATQTWSIKRLSVARAAIGAASNGEQAIFAGGIENFHQDTASTAVDRYDGTTDSWSSSK